MPPSNNWLTVRVAAAAADSRAAAVVSDSFVGRFVVRSVVLFVRSLSGEASWLGRTLTRRQVSGFHDLTAVASESGLYRLVASSAEAAGPAAWRASWVGQLLARTVAPLDLAAKIRLVAWVGLVAAGIKAALQVGPLLRGDTSGSFWFVVIAALATLWIIAPRVAR